MGLEIVHRGQHWLMQAIASTKVDDANNEVKTCELLQFLSELSEDATYCKDVAKFYTYAERCCANPNGPKSLGVDICHDVHSWTDETGREVVLWQITAGGIRVVFFYEPGKLIICTHGFKKKRQKFDTAEGRHAETLWRNYCKSK